MPALLETRSEPHNKKQTSKGKVLLTGKYTAIPWKRIVI